MRGHTVEIKVSYIQHEIFEMLVPWYKNFEIR